MEENTEKHLTRTQKKELLLALLEALRDPASMVAQVAPTETRLARITQERCAVLDFYDKDIDFTDVFVCPECFEIRGSWKAHGESFRQRCRCEQLTLSVPETWFAFDFNKLCDLCYCCGAELVQTGFETSVWFCAECRQRVEKLNEERGRCVIPMGRFSSVDQNDVVAALNSWNRRIVQDNLRACGFSEADPAPLATYLETLAERPADKKDAFDQLCAFLGIDANEGR